MIIKEVEVKNGSGKTFNLEIYLNGRSIKQIEKEAKMIDPKQNFYTALNAATKMEFTYNMIVLGGVTHLKGNKNPVGSEWFDDNDISFFGEAMTALSVALGECLKDIQPTNTGK